MNATCKVPDALKALEAGCHKFKRTGDGKYVACCPAHDDRHPSLSIAIGDNGGIVVFCQSRECRPEDICSKVGLTIADLCPPKDDWKPPQGTNGKHRAHQANSNGRSGTAKPKKTHKTAKDAIRAAEWVYRDAGGRFGGEWTYKNADAVEYARVVRIDLADGSKKFTPLAAVPGGYQLRDPDRWLPYRLPQLLNALEERPGEPVFICEGEKAANAAAQAGLIATASAHGSKSAAKTEWGALAGQLAVILPDNDEPGEAYARDAAGILAALTPPARVKIVHLPDLPEGGDYVEFAAIGGTAEDALKWANSAPFEGVTPDSSAKSGVVSTVSANEGLKKRLTPYRPFPVECLPQPVANYIAEGSAAIGCDPSYIALPLITAAGAAIGNTRRALLKTKWAEPPVLWTASVGDSGTMKSPSLDMALRFTRRAQDRLFKDHKQRTAAHKEEMREWKTKPRSERGEQPEDVPPCERLLCSDATAEALADRLTASPRGMLVAVDELAGWFNGFNQYKAGKGGDVAHWLSMHRAGYLLIDRKNPDKPTMSVPMAAVSVTGTIQPGSLRKALTPEFFENGLAARILTAHPPRRPKQWTEAEIDPAIEQLVANVFRGLYELKPEAGLDDEFAPTCIPLNADAKATWIAFVNQTGREQFERGEERLIAAWSKLEGYAARLALIFHQVRHAAGDPSIDPWRIDQQSMEAGIHLSRWFGYEAERVYLSLSESEQQKEDRQLVEVIQRAGGSISARELMRRKPTIKTAEDASVRLRGLVERLYGFMHFPSPSSKGGHPTAIFTLHGALTVDTTPDSDAPEGVSSPETAENAQPEAL